MTAATSFTATPPPPTTFEVGVRAELFGLKSKAELNGCFGVVTKNLLSIGRLAVKLDDGRGPRSPRRTCVFTTSRKHRHRGHRRL